MKKVVKGAKITSAVFSHGKWAYQYGVANCDAVVSEYFGDMSTITVDGEDTAAAETHKITWSKGFPAFPVLEPL